MRVQTFNHATVFPKDPTAKLLHIWTARSSQGGFYYIMANGQGGSEQSNSCSGFAQHRWLARPRLPPRMAATTPVHRAIAISAFPVRVSDT